MYPLVSLLIEKAIHFKCNLFIWNFCTFHSNHWFFSWRTAGSLNEIFIFNHASWWILCKDPSNWYVAQKEDAKLAGEFYHQFGKHLKWLVWLLTINFCFNCQGIITKNAFKIFVLNSKKSEKGWKWENQATTTKPWGELCLVSVKVYSKFNQMFTLDNF